MQLYGNLDLKKWALFGERFLIKEKYKVAMNEKNQWSSDKRAWFRNLSIIFLTVQEHWEVIKLFQNMDLKKCAQFGNDKLSHLVGLF